MNSTLDLGAGRRHTKSRRRGAKAFVRVAGKKKSTRHIAACESSGRLPVCLLADCDYRSEVDFLISTIGDMAAQLAGPGSQPPDNG